MTSHFLFTSWSSLGRIALAAVLGYGVLLLFLRVSGKRSLAKMNVFDFVFVVAVGSVLASTITSSTMSLADGLVALGVLVATQNLFAWLTARSERLNEVINGEPSLLVHRGRILWDVVRAQQVTEEEILAAARQSGARSLGNVDAMVLETDGSFSVLQRRDGRSAARDDSTLRDVPEARRAKG